MSRSLFIIALVGLAACEESELEGLAGRWSGSIYCYETSQIDITMSIAVQEGLRGSAKIRHRDNNTNWSVRGEFISDRSQNVCWANRDCPVNTTEGDGSITVGMGRCVGNPVCIERVKNTPHCQGQDAGAPQGDGGAASCDPCDNCEPCQLCADWDPSWRPLLVELESPEVVLPTPQLKLWPYGDSYMTGTIRGFCGNEEAQAPEVVMRKQ